MEIDLLVLEGFVREYSSFDNQHLAQVGARAFEESVSQTSFGSLPILDRYEAWVKVFLIPALKHDQKVGAEILKLVTSDHVVIDAHLVATVSGFLISNYILGAHLPLGEFAAVALLIIRLLVKNLTPAGK